MIFYSPYIYGANFIAKFRWENGFLNQKRIHLLFSVWATTAFLEVSTQQTNSQTNRQIYIFWFEIEFHIFQDADIIPPKISYMYMEFSSVWMILTAHNWQKWKSTFLARPAAKICRVEAVGLKSYNYTLKSYDFCEYVKIGAIFLKI